jgi:hypothetical protein
LLFAKFSESPCRHATFDEAVCAAVQFVVEIADGLEGLTRALETDRRAHERSLEKAIGKLTQLLDHVERWPEAAIENH